MLFFNKKRVLGLDMGTSSIKLAEINIKDNHLELISFGIIPTPQQSIFGGDVLNPDALSEAVKTLVKKVNTKTKNTASGLWGTSVIVKKISIPKTEEDLIRDQVKWAAEQYVPYDINEISIDYKIIKKSPSQDGSITVLLVAATQKVIFNYAEFISKAGLICKILDVEGCALSNCFEVNHRLEVKSQNTPSKDQKNSSGEGEKGQSYTIGLLDLGASTTNFIVLEKGEIVFCRDIPIGGVTYTNELQKNLSVNTHEAESLKVDVSNGKQVSEEASSVIQASHDIIIDEIKGNIEFFLNTSDISALDQVYVTGGCIKVPGLLSSLEQNFNCKRIDPFNRIQFDEKKFSPQFIESIRDISAISVGLSLRAEFH